MCVIDKSNLSAMSLCSQDLEGEGGVAGEPPGPGEDRVEEAGWRYFYLLLQIQSHDNQTIIICDNQNHPGWREWRVESKM